jgi:hypothetical protein
MAALIKRASSSGETTGGSILAVSGWMIVASWVYLTAYVLAFSSARVDTLLAQEVTVALSVAAGFLAVYGSVIWLIGAFAWSLDSRSVEPGIRRTFAVLGPAVPILLASCVYFLLLGSD